MHTTAYLTGKCFFEVYGYKEARVLEIGSQNVNGALRDHAVNPDNYVGVDFCDGKGVDIVLEDAYKYPFQDNTFDIIVTSSCLEHSELFWLTYLECLRVLKPSGIFYCNVPGNRMGYHRHPVDCWRFMPDAAKALETWAHYNNIPVKVLETFSVEPLQNDKSRCFDWCAVFVKDKQYTSKYTKRMIDFLTLAAVNIFRFNDCNDNDWNRVINPRRAE